MIQNSEDFALFAFEKGSVSIIEGCFIKWWGRGEGCRHTINQRPFQGFGEGTYVSLCIDRNQKVQSAEILVKEIITEMQVKVKQPLGGHQQKGEAITTLYSLTILNILKISQEPG